MTRAVILGAALIYALGLGQLSTEIPTGPSSSAAWDAPAGSPPNGWLDVLGAAEELAAFEAAVTVATVDLAADPGAPTLALELLEDPAARSLPLATILEGLPEAPYKLWIRAIDRAGNRSAWSSPLPIRLDRTAPAAPAGIRVDVTIQVTVTGAQ